MVNACRDPESQKSPARALQATKLARWSEAEKNVDPLTIKRRHLEATARRPRATGPAAAVLAADGCFIILRVPTVQVDIAPRQLAGANAILITHDPPPILGGDTASVQRVRRPSRGGVSLRVGHSGD